MDLTNLHWLSASDAARLIRDGVVGSAELVQACLARVRETDAQVQAWAFLDPDHALAQARAADELRLSGQPVGPLHGVPRSEEHTSELQSRLHLVCRLL